MHPVQRCLRSSHQHQQRNLFTGTHSLISPRLLTFFLPHPFLPHSPSSSQWTHQLRRPIAHYSISNLTSFIHHTSADQKHYHHSAHLQKNASIMSADSSSSAAAAASSSTTPRGVSFLQQSNVPFEVREYDYILKGGVSASSAALGISEHSIIKTLLFQESEELPPFIVLMHGDASVDTKPLIRELMRTRGMTTGVNGEGVDSGFHLPSSGKKPRCFMCTPEVAEQYTGYQVGGTSPFGLKDKTLRVFMEASLAQLFGEATVTPKSEAHQKTRDVEVGGWDSQLATYGFVDYTQINTRTASSALLNLITPSWVLINGGARGTLVGLSVRNIVSLLRPILINVAKYEAGKHPAELAQPAEMKEIVADIAAKEKQLIVEKKVKKEEKKAAKTNNKADATATAADASSSSSPAPSTSPAASSSPAPSAPVAASTCLSFIRSSTARVMSLCAQNPQPAVTIDHAAIERELATHLDLYTTERLPPTWASDYHFSDGTDLTAQYVFVLDAVNFCFWPCEGYEYSDLAGSLRAVLVKDPKAFDAASLARVTPEQVETWLQPPKEEWASFWKSEKNEQAVKYRADLAKDPNTPLPRVAIPLLAARTHAIRELGQGFLNGRYRSAGDIIRSAKNDASLLVEAVTATFPAFRDSAVYRGEQVFLYKRAQILVGDIWGAFSGKGLGAFRNIELLTCFADYRVPQVLRACGILKYSAALAQTIDSRTEILPSEIEIELRCATIQAVEEVCKYLNEKKNVVIKPLQLDWILWERGEAQLKTLAPHHRVTTIFY